MHWVLDLGNCLKHLIDLQLAANELNLHVEEAGSGSSLVGKACGYSFATFTELARFGPVDLAQKTLVDPWPVTVGKLAS